MKTDAANLTDQPALLDEIFERQRITRLQIIVIVMAFSLNMLDSFDLTAMAFTVHSIGKELQIAPNLIGLIFSIALAGVMVGSMFISPYADVIGRRKLILICVTTIGLSVCMTAYVNSLWQLIVIRGITGLGVGGVVASIATLASEYASKKYRSMVVLIVSVGHPMGASLGGFIAAHMIPAYGWESIFLSAGILTLLMALAVYLWMPESLPFLLVKGGPKSLSEINNILRRLDHPELRELPKIEVLVHNQKANVFSLLTPNRKQQTVRLWVSFLFCFISLYFLLSWIPKLVVVAGMSEQAGIYASVAFSGGGIIGILSLGWLSARIGLSNLIFAFLTGAAVFMVLFAYVLGIKYLFLNIFVIGFLLQSGFMGLYAIAAKIYPTEIRTTGMGWAIGLGRFGAVIGPYIGGVLIGMSISMEANFVLFAIPLLISGIITYTLRVN